MTVSKSVDRLPTALDRLPDAGLAALAAGVYLVIGLLCLKLLVKPENVAPIWLGNAVMIAMLARLDLRRWHWVLLGQAVSCAAVNLIASISLGSTSCYVVGNVLETVLAASIITRLGKDEVEFGSLGQLLRLFVAAGPGNALTGAIATGASYYLAKGTNLVGSWELWTLADGLGMLVVLPALLSFRQTGRGQFWLASKMETGCMFGGIALLNYILFFHHIPASAYVASRPLLFTAPFLVWTALRTNVLGMSLAAMVMAGFAIGGSLCGLGPYVAAEPTVQRVLAVLQLTLMAWTAGGLIIAVVTEETRRALTAASQERERFQQLTESIGEVFWMAPADLGSTLYISPAYEKLWGRSCASLIADPKSFLDAIHPDDRARVVEDLPIQMTGKPFTHEYRVVQPDGSIRWVLDRGFPVTDAQGKVKHYAGVAQDITQQKEFQLALLEANDLNHQIISNVQDGIIVIDRDYRYRVWSPAMERMSGVPAENVLGKTPMELFPFLREVGVMAMLERAMSGETVSSPDFPFEVPETGHKGWSWQLMGPLRSADGEIIGVITTVRDITDRKRNDQLLRQSYERFEVLAAATFEGIVIHQEGVIVECNEQLARIFGYERSELIGTQVDRIIAPEDREQIMANVAIARDADREHGGMRKDGSKIFVEGRGRSATYSGMPVRITVLRDITDRKRADQTMLENKALLRQSLERFEVLAAATFEGIIIHEGGRVIDCNEQLAKIFGYKREELIGTDVRMMVAPDDREMVLANIAAGRDTDVEHGGMRKDGSKIIIEARGRVASYAGRPVRITAVRDVTHRVQMEELAIQSEKMLSIGGLAAGMAHEINNPLAVMVQNAEVVWQRISTDSPPNRAAAERAGTSIEAIQAYLKDREILQMLQGIHSSGERAASIVKNMLTFSRPRATTMSLFKLDELINQALQLMRSDYELKKRYDLKKLRVITDFDPALGPVPCHGSEVQQVLLNVFKNAVQACFSNSSHSVSPQLVVRTRRENQKAYIVIEDNGPGIPESVRHRVFEPFFTTKSPGEGTGLGLFVSYFIITHHHSGTMRVTANPGGGTCFEIVLPLKAQE